MIECECGCGCSCGYGVWVKCIGSFGGVVLVFLVYICWYVLLLWCVLGLRLGFWDVMLIRFFLWVCFVCNSNVDSIK